MCDTTHITHTKNCNQQNSLSHRMQSHNALSIIQGTGLCIDVGLFNFGWVIVKYGKRWWAGQHQTRMSIVLELFGVMDG
jgi:hypothetical protein